MTGWVFSSLSPSRRPRSGETRTGGVRHHRELQPLGLVDGHQLDGSPGLDGGLPLAGSHVAQGLDVLQELADADQAATVGVGQEFVHVAAGPVAAGQVQGSSVVGDVQ